MKLKFRAWTEEGEVMYYDVYPFKDDTLLLSYDEIAFDEVPASDFILMQSTGLFDKNCNEIFEGDIVVNQYGRVGYVAYLKQEAGFVVVLKKSDYRLGHRNTGESYDVTNDHEVIGDIYQNKELVEGK